MRDGGGLYLILRPDGARWWRPDYRCPLSGKLNTLSPGTYPDTGLAGARAERDRTRKQFAAGIDPGEHRKAAQTAGAERAGNSLEVMAREWLAVKAHGWTESHHAKQRVRLEAHGFPWVGKKPTSDVGVSDLRPLPNRMVELPGFSGHLSDEADVPLRTQWG